MVPSEKPPQLGLMILLIIGIGSLILLHDPSITGLAVYENEGMQDSYINEITEYSLGLISYENSVYLFELDEEPSSLYISGIVTSEGDGRARIYLVEEPGNPDSYKLITDQEVSGGTINFDNACVETCLMDYGRKDIIIAAKLDNARLIIDKLSYS